MIKNKKALILGLVVLVISGIFIKLPFLHGHYFDEYYVDEQWLEYKDISNEEINIESFSDNNYYNGFHIILCNKYGNGNGSVKIIAEKNGSVIGEKTFSTNDINNNTWYNFLFDKEVANYGETIIYRIKAENCSPKECMIAITEDNGILHDESFAMPTFKGTEKILVVITVWAIILFLSSKGMSERNKKLALLASTMMIGYVLLTSNYMFNNIAENFNLSFSGFERISNELVTNAIESDMLGVAGDQYGLTCYESQFGLQGFVFRFLARLAGYRDNNWLAFLAASATSVVFLAIVCFIRKIYNKLYAIIFFVVVWLSPWVINFARNLYWVEFTWFLPMLVGLFFLYGYENKKYRIISYAMAFVSILIKCLCGYEYITTIMLGLIAYPLVELLTAITKKDKNKASLLFKRIVILGVCALAGFACAIIMHAALKADGNIIYGIKKIIFDDALRRTFSNDFNTYKDYLWPSLNASVWETIKQYFVFKTVLVNNDWIIVGIHGSMFIPLIVCPLFIFARDYIKNNLNIKEWYMYIILFLTTLSWFVLAKAHSFIHIHLSFILWYFGFIQICLYIVIKHIVDYFKKEKE